MAVTLYLKHFQSETACRTVMGSSQVNQNQACSFPFFKISRNVVREANNVVVVVVYL